MSVHTGYADRKQGIEVLVIPALEDNYIYGLVWQNEVAIIDPADATPVLRLIRNRHLRLTHILVTHHHFDHVAGIAELKTATKCRVVGPMDPRIPERDDTVEDGAVVQVSGFDLTVISTPGHSHTHVAYYDAKRRMLWSGDTLFGAGCGRLFDCPVELMWNSIHKLAALPEDTLVFFGHEYTAENLRFAATVEPTNADVRARQEQVQKLRDAGKPTVPSTISLEKKTNPFLRAESPAIRKYLDMEGAPGIQVFAELRRRKDSF